MGIVNGDTGNFYCLHSFAECWSSLWNHVGVSFSARRIFRLCAGTEKFTLIPWLLGFQNKYQPSSSEVRIFSRDMALVQQSDKWLAPFKNTRLPSRSSLSCF